MSATDKPDARPNLTSPLERDMTEVISDKQQETWAAENREVTIAYNKHVDEHGVFSDGLRSF